MSRGVRRFISAVSATLILTLLLLAGFGAAAAIAPAPLPAQAVMVPAAHHHMDMQVGDMQAGDMQAGDMQAGDMQAGEPPAGVPCRNHDRMDGLACCTAGGCMMGVGLVARAALIPQDARPTQAPYRAMATLHPDGISPPPTRKRPRRAF